MEPIRLFIISAALSVVSCANNTNEHNDTSECMHYRSMMTAPMPQAAVDDLRIKCEISRQ